MAQPWWKNDRGEWYVIVQLGLFVLIGFSPILSLRLIQWQLPFPSAVFGLGLSLGGIGCVFILLGLAYLGRNLSPLPHPKSDSSLVETGIYRLVRHPIYAGLILGAIGWALLWRSPLTLLFAALLFIFFDIKSRREEAWLNKKFPAYGAYQQRVRKLIPYLY